MTTLSARVRVLGVPVDLLTFDDALERAAELAADRGTASCAVAVNPEKVMIARRAPDVCQFIADADLAFPDGIGVVLACRAFFKRKVERVAGADLMQALCRESGRRGLKIFVYGAREDVNARACGVVRERWPDALIVGRENGYLPEERHDELIARINASGANILFLALGSPKQEEWIARHRTDLRVGLCMGIGGTLDVLAGNVKRAPALWQKAGLEWLYRLLRQPSRFWRQRRIFLFAALTLAQLLTGQYKKESKDRI